MFYISYGSNLNIKKMSRLCPRAVPIFKFKDKRINNIIGWRLIFNKFATIIPNKFSYVPVGIWKITKKCEKILDDYEQFPQIYKKKYIYFGSCKAMIYVMKSKKCLKPSRKYFEEILDGYKDFNLDINYLYSAKKNVRF